MREGSDELGVRKFAIAGKPAMESTRFDVDNHQLNGFVATELVEVELVGQFHPLDGRVRPNIAVDAEGDTVEFDRTAFAFSTTLR